MIMNERERSVAIMSDHEQSRGIRSWMSQPESLNDRQIRVIPPQNEKQWDVSLTSTDLAVIYVKEIKSLLYENV